MLATRNRQDVLRLSIPLMLVQSRLPRRFIVVDCSDDHAAVHSLLTGIFSTSLTGVDLVILKAPEAGSSYQRNIGLRHVSSPVIIFPDDDVLWYPGTADALMRVYERDVEKIVGCVAASVASTAPDGTFVSGKAPYQLELRDRVSKTLRRLTTLFEQRWLSDPMSPGNTWMGLWGPKTPPRWLQEEDAELCGPVFGYRISFRSEVICGLGGFDERLGRYSMFEDSDAALGSLNGHLNVCARRAKVFHYRVPGERVRGAEFGMMAILNRTYVTCKHSPPGSTVRRMLKRYLYYKIARYSLQTHTHYGRERFRGAVSVMGEAQRLIDAPPIELSERYMEARRRFF